MMPPLGAIVLFKRRFKNMQLRDLLFLGVVMLSVASLSRMETGRSPRVQRRPFVSRRYHGSPTLPMDEYSIIQGVRTLLNPPVNLFATIRTPLKVHKLTLPPMV